MVAMTSLSRAEWRHKFLFYLQVFFQQTNYLAYKLLHGYAFCKFCATQIYHHICNFATSSKRCFGIWIELKVRDFWDVIAALLTTLANKNVSLGIHKFSNHYVPKDPVKMDSCHSEARLKDQTDGLQRECCDKKAISNTHTHTIWFSETCGENVCNSNSPTYLLALSSSYHLNFSVILVNGLVKSFILS